MQFKEKTINYNLNFSQQISKIFLNYSQIVFTSFYLLLTGIDDLQQRYENLPYDMQYDGSTSAEDVRGSYNETLSNLMTLTSNLNESKIKE